MTLMLRDLRARIARIEGFTPERQARVCPTGWNAVDAALPGGGLLEGALHEIHSPDPADGAALGFAMHMLNRFQTLRPGQSALWASCRADLFAPGLHAVGVDPAGLVIAHCRASEEILDTIEEGLKSNAVSVVFGEIGELDFALSRRLQLAAVDAGTTLILLRPRRFGSESSAAVTRWCAEACPCGWKLTLFRCRNGRPCHWQMTGKVGECR